MTTSQKAYIALVKRPIGFLGALVALILLGMVDINVFCDFVGI